MTRGPSVRVLGVVGVLGLAHTEGAAFGGVVPFTFVGTYEEFLELNSEVTRIDFSGFETYPQSISDQYSDLGVQFLGPWVSTESAGWTLDGFGAKTVGGPGDEFVLDFDAPIQHFGFWKQEGSESFRLYAGDFLVLATVGDVGETGFFGIESVLPFDRIEFTGSGASMDDIVFGTIVPAPGVVVFLASMILLGSDSRRRR